jgi:hypothetical protein
MREANEHLGWCPHCGQSTWHRLRSEDEQGRDLNAIANTLSNITLKESLGEPLTKTEQRIKAFTLSASSHSMNNRYGTYIREDFDGT